MTPADPEYLCILSTRTDDASSPSQRTDLGVLVVRAKCVCVCVCIFLGKTRALKKTKEYMTTVPMDVRGTTALSVYSGKFVENRLRSTENNKTQKVHANDFGFLC